MRTCEWILFNGTEFSDSPNYCGKPCEGKNALCATHSRESRKLVEQAEREAEKRAQKIEKANAKNSIPRKKPNKVSEKMQSLNANYIILADEFKRQNPTCLARVNEYCTGKTESVHHKRGRGRYLLDVSTFFPCCLSCHDYIEAHPKEAKERGWSMSRLQTTEPHKI